MSVTTTSEQWQSSPDGTTAWANIVGATGTTYTPVSGDAGKFIRSVETGTDDGGSATANSNVVGPVAAAATSCDTNDTEHQAPRIFVSYGRWG